MDYPSNARKTRGKEECYIVQSLQLQPLLCRPRDRRNAVSGAGFNGSGIVSGAVHQRVKASSTSGVPTCRASGYAHPTQPHHPSIVVAAPCAGQQGTCIQQPEDVFLQALVHKDVGRHKARPLQLLVIEKNDYIEIPPQSALASLGQRFYLIIMIPTQL